MFAVANTHAYKELVPQPPRVSLISFGPLISMVGQILIIIPAQFIVWSVTIRQPW